MRILSLAFCLSLLLLLTVASDAQTTFTNATAIPIADGDSSLGPGVGNPYPSTIAVSGLSGTVTDVNVRINGLTHTFPDDVGFLLVAPNGARMVIQTDAGGGGDVANVTYTFDDQAAGLIPNTGPIAAGSFKPSSYDDTSASGTGDDFFPLTGANPPPADCFNTPCPQAAPTGTATLNGTFGGINPNGTWKLYAIDCCAMDTGSVTAGWSLIITTNGGGGNTAKTAVDFNGDHKTDFVVVRNTGGGSGGQVTWFVALTGGSPLPAQPWGISTDFFVPADYDGDGKTDYAIWRPGTQGTFFILNSQTFTVRTDALGTMGDDPTVVGDYNGDGADDPAVYRPGATAGAASTWFYRTSSNVNFVAVNFGQNGDTPCPGDYDGDHKNDFVIQRDGGTGLGVFYKLLTTGVFTTEVFGNATDVVVPGDYDGDGKTDIAVAAASSGKIVWSYRPSSGGATVSDTWGVTSDFAVQGDYTGDGKTDFAVWRPSTGTFFVLTPITKNIIVQPWGATGDYPVANFNAH